MTSIRVMPLLALAAPLLISACGGSHHGGSAAESNEVGASADRTVEVQMADNEFVPPSIEVERGETIKFVFENSGEVDHDAFIGDAGAQADHEDEMREADDMGHGARGDEDAVTVEPGEEGTLVHTFAEAGEIEIGCHQPGHYDSGMKAAVTVS